MTLKSNAKSSQEHGNRTGRAAHAGRPGSALVAGPVGPVEKGGHGVAVIEPEPRLIALAAIEAAPTLGQVDGQVVSNPLKVRDGKRAHWPTTPPRCLDVQQAAGYLGITPRTIWRLVERGVLHPVRLPRVRKVLLDVADLAALVETSK